MKWQTRKLTSNQVGLKYGFRSGLEIAISEELELKPALINKAISIAHKDNYKNLTDDLDTLEKFITI